MEKVIAIVVTYNRRSLLSECITALRNQTRKLDAILVVNNGSTDSTEDWLFTQKDLFFISQNNVGSAGGFNTGISWAYKHGYSWIWCMDDDGYPKEDALENILKDDLDRLCLRNCAVINKEDKKTFVWKTKKYKTINDVDTRIVKGVCHPFNGTMLHRNIVERVGVPKQNLFLWGDETEYLYRITQKNKIPACTITDSIHYHPAAAASYKKDWDFNNNWKMYYYVRNRFYILQSKLNNRLLALFNYCFFLFAMMGVIIVFQKTDRLKKMNFIFWPAADAFTNNFSANPQNILVKLNTEPGNKRRFNNNLKNLRSTFTILFAPAARGRRAANA
jgi:rhamnopyranosyl-N-acetylglucosaminyl-diphospho-decaprenol beta-1,3/1,4-galactofuranosyltransferase